MQGKVRHSPIDVCEDFLQGEYFLIRKRGGPGGEDGQ